MDTLTEKDGRIKYIDYLKCFAIFSVVFGHTLSFMGQASTLSRFIDNIIVSYNMPLFALLSGMFFFVSGGLWDFIKKKSIQLLIPYFAEVVVCFFLVRPLLIKLSGNSIESSILMYVLYSFAYWGAWFLRALFLCFICAYVSVKVARGYLLGALFSIFTIHAIFWFGIIPNKQQALQGFLYLYPFFWAGWLIKYYDHIIKRHLNVFFLISFTCYITLLQFWDSRADSFYYMDTCIFATENGSAGHMIMWKTLYRTIIGISAALSFYFLFRMLNLRFVQRRSNLGRSAFWGSNIRDFSSLLCPFYYICAGIGRCTLGIYILQSIIFDNWSLIRCWTLSLLGCLLFTILLIVICYSTVVIGCRWRIGELILRGRIRQEMCKRTTSQIT